MGIDNTKESILSVADKLFSRFGFHKTSMDEIARIARKAKGSLYYNFASKEDLFKAVIANELDNLKSQLSVIVNNPNLNASQKLKNYLVKRMEILNTAANYHETLKADFFEHFHFVDDLRIDLDDWEKGNLKKIIQQGVDNSEFVLSTEINILIEVFIMILKGLEIPFFLQDKYGEFSRHFDGMINILTKGLSI